MDEGRGGLTCSEGRDELHDEGARRGGRGLTPSTAAEITQLSIYASRPSDDSLSLLACLPSHLDTNMCVLCMPLKRSHVTHIQHFISVID